MSNSPFQIPGLPPMMSDLPSTMQGGLEFWQKLMGLTQQLPTGLKSITPTLNLEELDQRLTDLRAVEAWLQLNLSMLQSSIQALEVQRSTIATLKAFGAPFTAMTEPPSPPSPATEPAPAATPSRETAPPKSEASTTAASSEPASNAEPTDSNPDPALLKAGEQWWKMVQAQFDQIAKSAGASALAPNVPSAANVAPPRAATGRTRPPSEAGATQTSASSAQTAQPPAVASKKHAGARKVAPTKTSARKATAAAQKNSTTPRGKGKA